MRFFGRLENEIIDGQRTMRHLRLFFRRNVMYRARVE
jgi:hypothetical protein